MTVDVDAIDERINGNECHCSDCLPYSELEEHINALLAEVRRLQNLALAYGAACHEVHPET